MQNPISFLMRWGFVIYESFNPGKYRTAFEVFQECYWL